MDNINLDYAEHLDHAKSLTNSIYNQFLDQLEDIESDDQKKIVASNLALGTNIQFTEGIKTQLEQEKLELIKELTDTIKESSEDLFNVFNDISQRIDEISSSLQKGEDNV